MFTEDLNGDDYIQISALQHVLFCERQFSLIYIEQIWRENLFTAEGRLFHERVDFQHHESRKNFHQEFGLSLISNKHGLIGKADLVEIYCEENKISQVIPVEFKRGTVKLNDCDRVQLCGQALCLEEMFSIPIKQGYLYYHKNHRRLTVEIDENLRTITFQAINKIREILTIGKTILMPYDKNKCDRCSLFEICMPKTTGAKSNDVKKFIESELKELYIDGKDL